MNNEKRDFTVNNFSLADESHYWVKVTLSIDRYGDGYYLIDLRSPLCLKENADDCDGEKANIERTDNTISIDCL